MFSLFVAFEPSGAVQSYDLAFTANFRIKNL